MFSFSRRTFFPIGIDVSHDFVRLVQLCRHSQGGLSVSAATRRALNLPADAAPATRLCATAEAIAAVMAMNEFNGRRAAVSLPSELVRIRTARLAAVPVMGGAIPADLQALFDVNLADATLRLIHAGPVRHSPPEGEEIIAIAIGDERLNDFTQAIHDRGVRPVSMEVRMLSLHRAAVRCSPPSPATALLEIDGDWSRLLIAHGAGISFLKEIPVGVGQLINTLAKSLSISTDEARELRRRTLRGNQPEDQNDPVWRAVADAGRAQMQSLASEVARCLRYHAVTFRGRQPSSLIVCGVQADDNQLNTLLKARTGLHVSTIDPFQNIDTSVMRAVDRTQDRSEWGVALGLALREADSVNMTIPADEPVENSHAAASGATRGAAESTEVAVA